MRNGYALCEREGLEAISALLATLDAQACSATIWMGSLRRSEAPFWRSRLKDDCRGAAGMQAVF
jgi:hypothetical protein